MPLQITSRHMTLSEDQKDYINKKVERLRRACGKLDELHFTITKEKLYFEADGLLRAGTMKVTAMVQASQPMEALDMVVDKLEHTLSRQNAKRVDRSKASRDKQQAKIDSLKLTPAELSETA